MQLLAKFKQILYMGFKATLTQLPMGLFSEICNKQHKNTVL